ncbi:MAG: hypothetical protein N2486_08835 [Caloramator sp.]|nr:hypothetical protein [Caloramator sp.]
MKKLLTSLLMLVLAVCFVAYPIVGAASTKKKVQPVKEVESGLKNGVIVDFGANYVVIKEAGKNQKYVLNNKTKIYYLGNLADIMEIAKKGLKVSFKVWLKNNIPQYLTYLEIPAAGLEGQGIIGMSLIDLRTNVSDDSVPPSLAAPALDDRTQLVNGNIVKTTDLNPEVDNQFQFVNNKTLRLGRISVVPGTLTVKVEGKEYKLIEANAEFTADDQFKMTVKDGVTDLVFKAELPAKNQAEADEKVQVTYQKKIYEIKTAEINSFPIHEDVYVELNGKEVSLAKALYRGTYFYTLANDNGEIVYINAFYKDAEAVIKSIKGNNIELTIIKYGKPAFVDTVTVEDWATITDQEGNTLELKALRAGDKIRFSVDPDSGYKVVEILKLK